MRRKLVLVQQIEGFTIRNRVVPVKIGDISNLARTKNTVLYKNRDNTINDREG